MQKSVFRIPQMDCASEEQLVRMKLSQQAGIASLDFDLPNRRLQVYHHTEAAPVLAALEALDLGATLVHTEAAGEPATESPTDRRLLWQVLLLNFIFFAIEAVSGYWSESMGLLADSLDMLADSLVYGMALFAVDGSAQRKKNIAKGSGYFQLTLAVLGFAEVLRRFFFSDAAPGFITMVGVSALALGANALALYLLQKSKSTEVHMQASKIFTSNDIVANAGVLLAGVLVYLTGSKLPDLVVGTVVFVLVARGALRILRL